MSFDGKPYPPVAGPAEPDTRRRIVTAAAEVFSSNGFARSTTRSIAKAAGVSEVTLFRHFDSKESLFQAVMKTYGSTYIVRSVEGRLTGSYRGDLTMIGNFFTAILLEQVESVVLIMCEAKHFPEMRPLFSQLPGPLWQMLGRYLQRQMDAGVVRAVHPEAAAQAFFASFYSYALQKKMLQLEPKPEITADEFVEQVVDVFVKGTIAGNGEAVKQ